MRRKPAALHNIRHRSEMHARSMGSSERLSALNSFTACAHRFLSEYGFEGSELLYSDPPYLRRTRTSKHRYRFDYEEADHVELLDLLEAVPCQVMVSRGHRSALYEERLEGWRRVELQVINHAGVRTECVWMNFALGPVALGPLCGEELHRPPAHQAQGTELGPALQSNVAGGRAPGGAGGDDGGPRPRGRPAPMATVNKSSLRAEFDALKARFESLCAEGKMSADCRALFDALLMLFEVLMAVFMEKHTPKSSANSSLPGSQSPNDDTARTRPGAKGKGPSYNDARCANTRTRESVSGAQRRCMRALWRGPRRYRLHRPRAAHPHRHRVREGGAPRRRTNQALPALPRRDPGTLPPRGCPDLCSTAPASKPTSCTCSSRRCSRSSVSPNRCTPSSVGTLSEATLLGYVAQLHHALAQWESQAIERLLASPAMHVR